MGVDNGSSQFDWSSSSWLWGPTPYYAYEIQDTNTITVNGPSATISNTGGSISHTANSATFQNTNYNNYFAGNTGYNMSSSVGAYYWNWTAAVTTMVILWQNTQSYYNNANVTKWF
jgi:hypothetical protein